MIIDVGVLYRANGAKPLEALEMVIPARVVKQIDLSKEVLKSENARLIFGRHYVSNTSTQLELKGIGRVRVIAVATIGEDSKLDRLPTEGGKDLTALRVAVPEVPKDVPLYSRVRFVVDSGGSLWRWNRVLGRRSGAIVDFRVHDPREGGAGANAPPQIRDRDLPIANLEAFFMLPDRFQIAGQNPPLTYTRTLEGSRWKSYLRRGAGSALRREAILVHRWSKLTDAVGPAVSEERPFRGYLQFQRVPGLRATSDLVLQALGTVLLAFAVFAGLSLRGGLKDSFDWLGNVPPAGYHLAVAAGITIVVVVSWVFAKIGKIPKAAHRVKRSFKRAEHWWYRKFGR